MGKKKIYITRNIPAHLIAPYENEFDISMWESETTPVPRDVLFQEAKQADGVICLLTEKMDAEFFQANDHLEIVANNAVGYDNVDIMAAQKYGVTITNTPDVLTETTADLAFTLLMATARRIVEASKTIEENKWGDWSPFTLAGADVYGKTLGIVGMGRIGEAVARRAKGFQMDVLYHNRSRKKEVEAELNLSYANFDELLAQSDFVLSLVPLSEATEKMFDEDAFARMKSSAIFINVSRGGVVDEAALYDALKNGTIRAAGLDVFEKEPIFADHPFVRLDNAVLLPHIGSASVETREAMLNLCLKNVSAVLRGSAPVTEVTE